MKSQAKKGQFTGWHMLAIMVAFFSVIIVVNLTMAFFARSSWTGMVVGNTHIASRQFNEKAAEGRAQMALGWKPELTIVDGKVHYRLVDSIGNVMAATRVTASFRRPTHASEDQEVVLTRQPDASFSGSVELRDGLWIVEVDSEAGLAHPYRDTRRLTFRNGTIQ
ncbi:FixH family protein [Shinella daejeonensis]|uniref:FixH family protein n=1 Tax=Shinella daejeonensis TaxID=659017 RepID=UPI0020C7A6B7|nr:FixH family protein [Shinella daejeonensis]MCP8894612.1 FixH family protein [Shinella daejeonensis]